MALLEGAIVGAVVGELLKAVLDVKDKAVQFKPTLNRLEETLKSIEPLAKQIDDLNNQLARPKEETEGLIQEILRLLMQPEVWRFVGFASTTVGLVCYALSTSFNRLFGKWNLVKIFLYIVFSFTICFMILFAKRWRPSRSLRFKAHCAFLVLTGTSIYSFFFDKVANGKPDVYSLISCAAFAIMSLSLSRQTHCGFEVDFLYFFLGCLIVQLMKIKLALAIIGVGFSYALIVLRSSLDSISHEYLGVVPDEHHVTVEIDSQQLASITDISSVRHRPLIRTQTHNQQQNDSSYQHAELDRPKEEMEGLIELMRNAEKLVLRCSKVRWWNVGSKAIYQKKLEDLHKSIIRFFDLNMQAQRNRKIESMGLCTPPRPPAFTVGLDVPLRDLKSKLLPDHMSVLVQTITGMGGSGKSTLAKMFCWDEQVQGKFKENIFFVTFAKSPKLTTVVQKLFKHITKQEPEFQSNEDARNQLGTLLARKKEPLLLVLDDVWRGSESLVDEFVFEIPNYLILVTSRVGIINRSSTTPCTLKPLGEADAITLFHHSASLDQSNYSDQIDDDDVKEIVKGCCGSPIALTVIGKLLIQKDPAIWRNRAKELSSGHSRLNSYSDFCLQKGFDNLNAKITEFFKDLGLFPEDQRIRVPALVDMWVELHGEEENEDNAIENIFQLSDLSLVDIFVTRSRKVAIASDYSYHYVTQHDLLRELAIHQTSQEPPGKRNRLILDITGNNILPRWWTTEKEYHILSISTDETFNLEWCNLEPATEVEVFVLNLREKKFTLPMFMKKMKRLKVLVITNYDFCRAELENFELLDYLSDLKRVQLEKVSIPFLSKTGVPLKNLQKLSFFMCNVNEAFKNSTTFSTMLPNLVEMNIDYCDVAELPDGISDIVHIKKLSITNCHKFSALPEEIGKLVNLESLRLSSCTGLVELPDSITNLHKLKFLDISDCINLGKLPENIGNLVNLEKLNVRGCSGLSELPYSVTDLGNLREVVCDEEGAALWEPFTSLLSDLKLEVTQEEINLKWLL